jgi:uncharacterized membrane protein YcaP (DUF421 family)
VFAAPGCGPRRMLHSAGADSADAHERPAMWHTLFAFEIPVLEKVVRTVLVYALIVVIFRLTGKRAIASMNTMDFVVMFLLSNVVQNAIIGPDNSFSGGAVGAVTLVLVNALVDRLAYVSPAVRRLLEGRPAHLVRDAALDSRALHRLAIREVELEHAVRVQNGDDLAEVQTAVLETNGQLVVTLKEADQSASRADVADLRAALARIETMLAAQRTS